jgi:hypothetical protein
MFPSHCFVMLLSSKPSAVLCVCVTSYMYIVFFMASGEGEF